MLTIVLAVAVVMLAATVGYEAYMRRQDLRIYRSLLFEESADRIVMDRRIDAAANALIEQLQRHAVSMERTIANTQAALMWTAWRLAEAGVLGPDDAPGSDVETIN